MLVVRTIPEIVNEKTDNPFPLGPFEDAFLKRTFEQFRNSGDDVNAH
ncbi:MAG: hypothetical protein HW374_772, partial [Bacteroidetes bacterium]|nr:hypothetical protein [Bacteroidota bacterium]